MSIYTASKVQKEPIRTIFKPRDMNTRFGFVKVAAATPLVKIADCHANAEAIDKLTAEAVERGASVVVFPELSLTGYTCGDLFLQSRLLEAGDEALV